MALAKAGQRVAVVDADFGLRNLDLLLGLENRIVYTALDVLAGECRLDQALVKDKRQPNLALLPAGLSIKIKLYTFVRALISRFICSGLMASLERF